MTMPPPDELDSALSAAEEELIARVEAACALEPEAPGAENTGELVRLEEALHSAARAAERAIDLRRQRRLRDPDDVACGVREFRDRAGAEWRLWAVTPVRGEGERGSLDRLRAEYQDGWLTFETLDGSDRRRLPGFPEDWATRSVAALEELLAVATRVPARAVRERGEGAPEGRRTGEP